MLGNTEKIYGNINQCSTLSVGISATDIPHTTTRTSRGTVNGSERTEVHQYTSTRSCTAENWVGIFTVVTSGGGN